jgi:hypothetical protein
MYAEDGRGGPTLSAPRRFSPWITSPGSMVWFGGIFFSVFLAAVLVVFLR